MKTTTRRYKLKTPINLGRYRGCLDAAVSASEDSYPDVPAGVVAGGGDSVTLELADDERVLDAADEAMRPVCE